MKILSMVWMLAFAFHVPLVAQETQDPQSEADTSAAQAAIQALKSSSQATSQSDVTFPALKTESCKVVVPYVDSPSGLLREWDQAVHQYGADDNRIRDIQKIKSDLLSDTWWARSSGPDVARAISTFCGLFEGIAAAMTPEGRAIKFATDLSHEFDTQVSKRSVEIYDAISKGKDTKEAMEAIREGTNELAIFATKIELQRVGQGQVAAAIGILQTVQKHAESVQEASEFKQTVQEQLGRLDEELSKHSNDLELQRQRMQAIDGIRKAVIAACNSDKQPPKLDEFFAANSGQTVNSSSQSQSSPSQPANASAVPWWASVLSSVPSTYGKTTSSPQAKTPQSPHCGSCDVNGAQAPCCHGKP